jgi:hypothetical protein
MLLAGDDTASHSPREGARMTQPMILHRSPRSPYVRKVMINRSLTRSCHGARPPMAIRVPSKATAGVPSKATAQTSGFETRRISESELRGILDQHKTVFDHSSGGRCASLNFMDASGLDSSGRASQRRI